MKEFFSDNCFCTCSTMKSLLPFLWRRHCVLVSQTEVFNLHCRADLFCSFVTCRSGHLKVQTAFTTCIHVCPQYNELYSQYTQYPGLEYQVMFFFFIHVVKYTRIFSSQCIFFALGNLIFF